MKTYSVIAPVKAGGKVYRSGTIELPAAAGDELVRLGYLTAATAAIPNTDASAKSEPPQGAPEAASATIAESTNSAPAKASAPPQVAPAAGASTDAAGGTGGETADAKVASKPAPKAAAKAADKPKAKAK